MTEPPIRKLMTIINAYRKLLVMAGSAQVVLQAVLIAIRLVMTNHDGAGEGRIRRTGNTRNRVVGAR
jgi:hypothetical protein